MAQQTGYVVLKEVRGVKRTWEVADANVTAHSAAAACRAVAETNDERGTYVALPSRSWVPVELDKKTTTRWTVGAPSESVAVEE